MKSFLILISVLFLNFSSVFAQVWEQKLNGRSVWSLASDNQGNVYAGGLTGSNSRIWKSSDGGNNWDTVYTASGQSVWDFAFDELGGIYAANYSSGMIRSTNNGGNFFVIPPSVFSNKNLQGVRCGNNGYVFVTTSTGFFRSTDYGQTFNETALSGLNCLPVAVDIDSSNIIYAGVTSASGSGIGFYRSTDFGLTFSQNLNPGKNCYSILQRLNGDLFMISTTSPYNIDISVNKGLTWTTIGNLPSAQRDISESLYGLYTAGNGGVFKSLNGGSNFVNYNFTLSATPVLNINYKNTLKLLAGVSGSSNGGVWIHTEGFILSANNSDNEISGYSLRQNYPNPFNPSTTIEFTLPEDKFVKLKVFDATGKEILSLVNNFLLSGNYSFDFNGNDLESGIYFYNLTAGNFNSAGKMILMK